jgi:hypothetical protein
MKATPVKAAAILFLLFAQLTASAQTIAALPNAFAHNDYSHKHPLFDALQNGYGNLEADIFLRGDRLVVAHINPYFKSHHVLEALYFKPLLDRINENGGQVYRGYNKPVVLMIDIKTEANSTYNALKPLLEKYRSILTSFDNGKVTEGLITVVLSGHKPYDQIRGEESRLAFIDEDLRKVTADTTCCNMFEMASCKYSKLLSWRGEGAISPVEHDRLVKYVALAHLNRERVRLWASPDNKDVWDELLADGVDLINTDNLPKLRNFLTTSATVKKDRVVASR